MFWALTVFLMRWDHLGSMFRIASEVEPTAKVPTEDEPTAKIDTSTQLTNIKDEMGQLQKRQVELERAQAAQAKDLEELYKHLELSKTSIQTCDDVRPKKDLNDRSKYLDLDV